MIDVCSQDIVLFPVILLIGGAISLFALIPPLRKWGRTSAAIRRMMSLLLGLVAFVLTFGLWTQFLVQAVLYSYEDEGVCQCSENPDYVDPAEVKQHKSALALELWRRAVIPPGLEQGCYSNEAEVCQIADKIPHDYAFYPEGWKGYFFTINASLLSAGVCGVLVWRWHRPQEI